MAETLGVPGEGCVKDGEQNDDSITRRSTCGATRGAFLAAHPLHLQPITAASFEGHFIDFIYTHFTTDEYMNTSATELTPMPGACTSKLRRLYPAPVHRCALLFALTGFIVSCSGSGPDSAMSPNGSAPPDTADPMPPVINPETGPTTDPTGPLQGNPDAFDDEFESDSLSEWSLRHVSEGSEAQYTQLDINGTTSGALTLTPTLTPGWFAGDDAPLIYKNWMGNFSVETEVMADSIRQPGLPPGSDFNSAGLMARNPAGGTGPENHVMVNIGRQDARIEAAIGSENKSTRNSESTLQLEAGSHRGRLILCRVDSRITTYRLLDNETQWSQIGAVDRPDLPDTLQVGMVANGFSGPDIQATFNYIRMHVPVTSDDCVRP